jgi:hypothetical protein
LMPVRLWRPVPSREDFADLIWRITPDETPTLGLRAWLSANDSIAREGYWTTTGGISPIYAWRDEFVRP